MSGDGIQPLSDCADLIACPKCGSHRVERFKVDRFEILACADCGTYDTEEVGRKLGMEL